MWSIQILKLSDETQLYFLNFVHQLEQQLKKKAFNASQYLSQILTYGDCLLAVLGSGVGKEVLFDEKITFLKKSVMSDDCCSLTDEIFSTMSEMSSVFSPLRLLNYYTIQMIMDDKENEQGPNVLDTCRNALDLSLKQCGKQHWNTAFCYLKMGFAENNAENYISALNAFEQALEIMTATHDGSSSSNADLADVYIGKGEAYKFLNKFESAVASFEEALRIKRKLFDESTEEIAQILALLGDSQRCFNDLSSGLARLEQALQIRKKLHAEKPCPCRYLNVVQCYCSIVHVHSALGNNTESIKSFKTALEVSADCDQERSFAHGLISFGLLNLEGDENVYMELLNSCLPVIKESYRLFLPILYLKLGSKQVESGKCKAGLAFFQEALDIELEITLRSNLDIREGTVSCYIAMVETLFDIGKFKLTRKAIERATQVAESLPECRQYLWIFRCYTWKGRIQNKCGNILQQLILLNTHSCSFHEFVINPVINSKNFNVIVRLQQLISMLDLIKMRLRHFMIHCLSLKVVCQKEARMKLNYISVWRKWPKK
ncbi:Nephrocystin-3 [Paramuricea clavata]|uniref:Nephrocystin-3 n=1 Tax=Paramuricea clavata TaxID=317549 RepID=A0A6S7HNQ9_PARCT|nr:Nephrocystin-3 [Paramuricea clavata]